MPINYTSVSFIFFFHIVALYGVIYETMTYFDMFSTFFMYYFTGLGITAGYHRLWAHKSYTASPIIQYILAFAGAGASQGSILWWSKYHRLHHTKSDTEDDPYGPQKGFLYSHILWIFENRYLPKLKYIDMDDLKYNKIVMFQHKYYVPISVTCSVYMPMLFYYLLGQDARNCFFFPVALARVILWHSTWCVNSLAHYLGTQSYGQSGTSRDHLFTAFVTFGEGYHNFHHEYPFDYRNGVEWYQYDPTKWLIEILYSYGFISDLKTHIELDKKIGYKDTRKDMTLDEYRNSNENLIVYKGGVYDVSDVLYNHPGGEKYIKMVIRKEEEYIIEQMNKMNNHTQNAFFLLGKCKVCNIIK